VVLLRRVQIFTLVRKFRGHENGLQPGLVFFNLLVESFSFARLQLKLFGKILDVFLKQFVLLRLRLVSGRLDVFGGQRFDRRLFDDVDGVFVDDEELVVGTVATFLNGDVFDDLV
jgi:hypothetical protein